jgi:hypothetical protein
MRYNFGVGAKVVFADIPNVASIYKDSLDVYDAIEYAMGHDVAVEASCWTELACVGEAPYENEKFTIEMVEV